MSLRSFRRTDSALKVAAGFATSLVAKPPYPNTGRRKQLAPVAVPKRVPDAPEPTIGDRFRFARKLASSLPPIGSD